MVYIRANLFMNRLQEHHRSNRTDALLSADEHEFRRWGWIRSERSGVGVESRGLERDRDVFSTYSAWSQGNPRGPTGEPLWGVPTTILTILYRSNARWRLFVWIIIICSHTSTLFAKLMRRIKWTLDRKIVKYTNTSYPVIQIILNCWGSKFKPSTDRIQIHNTSLNKFPV